MASSTLSRSTWSVGSGDVHTFLRSALRRPATAGALVPSSRAVAHALALIVPQTGAPLVIELGPGTGAISDAIGTRMPSAGQHLAIEIDPELAAYLTHTRPAIELVQGDATELLGQMAETARGSVDAVVSSLPWTLLPGTQQDTLLNHIAQVLKPDGAFAAAAHLTAIPTRAHAFRRRLATAFDEVILSKTLWRNCPPSRAYICRRPLNP